MCEQITGEIPYQYQRRQFGKVGYDSLSQFDNVNIKTSFIVNSNFGEKYPVKNYRRGIADLFGVILLKRRRIEAKCPLYGRDKAAEWAGTTVFGLYIHMLYIYKHM